MTESVCDREEIHIRHIQKRDGRRVRFDESRIATAVAKAMKASGEINEDEIRHAAWTIAEQVVDELKVFFGVPTIEHIQDMVEVALMRNDFTKTAKSYILYRDQRNKLRKQKKQVPSHVKKLAEESKKYFPNELSEMVYWRTYSRWIPEEGRRETWIETVDRYISFMRETLESKLSDDEYKEIHHSILNMEVMPSMRLLWSAGNAARKANSAAFNCCYHGIDSFQSFAEHMYLSMCGCGVGFSVENQFIQQLPIIMKQKGIKKEVFVVEDSREGWSDALKYGLQTWYEGYDVDFDCSKVRPAGSRLRTMGGRSSGKGPLLELLGFARNVVLSHQGRRMSTLGAHDIVCKVGQCVEMGGTRRVAALSLSDLHDTLMKKAKDGYFWINNKHRTVSNNSVAYSEKPTAVEFMDEWLSLASSGTGERGIFNREAAINSSPQRRISGVFGDLRNEIGVNPCVTSDTWIMTGDGPRQVSDLIGNPFECLVNGKIYKTLSNGFFPTGVKEVYKIDTKDGYSFKSTEDHPVLSIVGKSKSKDILKWKKAIELRNGDKIVLSKHESFSWPGIGSIDEGWILGELVGNGFKYYTTKSFYGCVRFWGSERFERADRALNIVRMFCKHRPDLKVCGNDIYREIHCVGLAALAEKYGILGTKKVLTEELEKCSSDFYVGFLQGFFDSDGTVIVNSTKGSSVRLSQSNVDRLYCVQRMLSRLGVKSKVFKDRRKSGINFLPDGHGGLKEYYCDSSNELIISRASLKVFYERIGFSRNDKQKKLSNIINSYKRNMYNDTNYAVVDSVRHIGTFDVYDVSVSDVHEFDANGVRLHNCSEALLPPKNSCNLSEVVAREYETKESLIRKIKIASILGTYQSTLTDFKYLDGKWKETCEEERLLGVSITGQWDCPLIYNDDGKLLSELKEIAVGVNKVYAKRFGINQSVAVTLTKPSGTVSSLVNSSPGVHPRYGNRYIRRIRISSSDPLFQMMREQGMPFVPETGQTMDSATTFVFEFPVESPKNSIVSEQLSAFDYLNHWLKVKRHYAEHTVSCTVPVRHDEWMAVGSWVYDKHWNDIVGLSFLPREDHIYDLAPYQIVSDEKLEEVKRRTPSIDYSKIINYEHDDETSGGDVGCAGGACTL